MNCKVKCTARGTQYIMHACNGWQWLVCTFHHVTVTRILITYYSKRNDLKTTVACFWSWSSVYEQSLHWPTERTVIFSLLCKECVNVLCHTQKQVIFSKVGYKVQRLLEYFMWKKSSSYSSRYIDHHKKFSIHLHSSCFL